MGGEITNMGGIYIHIYIYKYYLAAWLELTSLGTTPRLRVNWSLMNPGSTLDVSRVKADIFHDLWVGASTRTWYLVTFHPSVSVFDV